MPIQKIARFGWKPDLPDFRDHIYSVVKPIKLPLLWDMRPNDPPIYDQGQAGSCTGNAIGGDIEFEQIKQGKTPFVPSRLFIYWNERNMEGTVNEDSGASIRDGIKSVANLGVCHETLWPYNLEKLFDKPTPECYADAKVNLVLSYSRLNNSLKVLKTCLASGFPFIFGFTVYDSFESDAVAANGIVPMPQPGESVVGGHAVMCVGYKDSTKQFIVRNSWGTDWGDKGYCYMPYAYLTNSNLADDFWTIRLVE